MNYAAAACALEETAELFAASASGGISLLKQDQIRFFGNGLFFFFKGTLLVMLSSCLL